jgi:hypothetical protein
MEHYVLVSPRKKSASLARYGSNFKPFKIHTLHEFLGIQNSCALGGVCGLCACFAMSQCVCFATWVKLCHDLIQSAFKKMASRGHPSIQSDGWV